MENQGKLIIFSAPSGAGKTTIVQYLLSQLSNIKFSVSATTREARGEEINAKDYYFISKEDFLHRVAKHEFVEFEEVYDLFAIRIIIESEYENEKSDCWAVYSVVTNHACYNHSRWMDAGEHEDFGT